MDAMPRSHPAAIVTYGGDRGGMTSGLLWTTRLASELIPRRDKLAGVEEDAP